uniref:Uncharacterized protein n=1 Tax=Anopheles coluzzii TaxID=1518534 RepID=A0A8W7PW47_ANOCL
MSWRGEDHSSLPARGGPYSFSGLSSLACALSMPGGGGGGGGPWYACATGSACGGGGGGGPNGCPRPSDAGKKKKKTGMKTLAGLGWTMAKMALTSTGAVRYWRSVMGQWAVLWPRAMFRQAWASQSARSVAQRRRPSRRKLTLAERGIWNALVRGTALAVLN